ncbi:MAG TPA: response regulator transcription factor [Anaeromyxobacteraceae bacterium]|nr:response regulator transcription factor [Anaeromyxobacteraceae bacterium]
MLRVLLADDHQIVRQGLRALLERDGLVVAAEAGDGRQAAELARSLRPDAAVLDLSMPELNGIDAAREIARSVPGTRTVMLTMHVEERFAREALRAGVRGYVLKTRAASDLVQAVRDVCAGRVWVSPEVSAALLDVALDERRERDPLTARERQVLQLVGEGKTTKEVACALGVSVKTADCHRANLMRKLGVHRTADLVRCAIRAGLIQA